MDFIYLFAIENLKFSEVNIVINDIMISLININISEGSIE